jgi:hypothetical protein
MTSEGQATEPPNVENLDDVLAMLDGLSRNPRLPADRRIDAAAAIRMIRGAAADSARLDWLDRADADTIGWVTDVFWDAGPGRGWRDAIDAVRAKAAGLDGKGGSDGG